MMLIHYPTAFKALDLFIDLYNEKTQKLSERIRTGAVLTAKEIVRLYGVSLLKVAGLENILPGQLPSLQTNNSQLARLVKCSNRSIQRYLGKLQTAGIVTKKIFHGSNANYELFVNPEILLIKQRLDVDKLKTALNKNNGEIKLWSSISRNSELKQTSCRHTYSGNNTNILIAGEQPAKERSSLPLTFYDSGYRPGNEIGNSTGNTGENGLRVENSAHRNVAPDPARDHSLSLFVSLFWLMAKNLLYREVTLSEQQVLTAKNLITRLYEPVPTDRLNAVHLHYIARISLVYQYLQRDKLHRYVQLPNRYFDTNNPSGFVGTKKWYLAAMHRRKEVEKELIFGRTIKKYQNNLTGSQAKQKSILQVFRECENTIGKLNDKALTDRFHAAVLNQTTYQQLKTIHYN